MIAANAALGILVNHGLKNITARLRIAAAISIAIWLRAPAAKFTIVRLKPPATGIPPETAATRLAAPKAISS